MMAGAAQAPGRLEGVFVSQHKAIFHLSHRIQDIPTHPTHPTHVT